MRDTPGGLPAYTDRLAATADADRARAERRQQLLNAVVPAAPQVTSGNFLALSLTSLSLCPSFFMHYPFGSLLRLTSPRLSPIATQFMDPMFVEARKQAYAQARAAAEARALRRAERRARGPVEAPPPPVDPAFSFDFSFDAEAPAANAVGIEDGDDVPVNGVDAEAVAEGADADTGDADEGQGDAVDTAGDDAMEPSLTAPVAAPPSRPPPATATAALAVVRETVPVVKGPAPAPAPAPTPVPAVMTSTTYASRSASLQTPPAAEPRRFLQPVLSAPSFTTITATTTGSAAHAQGGGYPGAYERFRLTRPSSLLREGERYAAGSEIYKVRTYLPLTCQPHLTTSATDHL
jgi:hypothetical protein